MATGTATKDRRTKMMSALDFENQIKSDRVFFDSNSILSRE